MHVLSIAPYKVLPYQSGGQKLIALFNERLGALCRLTVVSTRDTDTRLVKHYTLLPLMQRSLIRYADISLYFKLRTIIVEQQVEYVIVEHPYMGWLGWLLQKTTRVKLVVHTHNIEFERFRSLNKPWWPLLKYYERWVLRKADIVFCISDEDKQYMIRKLQIAANKCYDIPFGITQAAIPTDKQACKEEIEALHHIHTNRRLFLFNGLLGYLPNLDALQIILNKINPLLQQQAGFAYTIVICGKGLPAEMNSLQEYASQNILYAGFVEHIDLYFKAADILLNPVITGGGVKTKLIEALGFNTTVVSTQSGAIGCDRSVCGDKLVIAEDTNWQDFVTKIIENTGKPVNTPAVFYDKYHWSNIAAKVMEVLSH